MKRAGARSSQAEKDEYAEAQRAYRHMVWRKKVRWREEVRGWWDTRFKEDPRAAWGSIRKLLGKGSGGGFWPAG